MKKAFAVTAAVVGVLAGIAVFTGPFARTGPGLLVMTLAALAALMLTAVAFTVIFTYRKTTITVPAGAVAAVAVVVIAVGAGAGYLTWHARSAAAPSLGTPAASSAGQPPSPATAGTGYRAQVAWTNDGGGGGSQSTNLYAFTSPRSHIHNGIYQIGESLTVACQIPDGRPIQVGPAYQGPDPHSTVWYQLDNSTWVPAVYVHVDRPGSVPRCR